MAGLTDEEQAAVDKWLAEGNEVTHCPGFGEGIPVDVYKPKSFTQEHMERKAKRAAAKGGKKGVKTRLISSREVRRKQRISQAIRAANAAATRKKNRDV